MDAREERGLIIAALCKLNRGDDGLWHVPSQSGAEKTYRVDPEHETCTCPDHMEAGFVCKHIRAVKIVIKREFRPDGTMIETKSVTFTEKKTYTQNWAAYNEAQTTEKHRFRDLLLDLCRGLKQPDRDGKRGRPGKPISDVVFSSVFKVYIGFSARRFNCDLEDAHAEGYLTEPVHCHAVNHYLERDELTPILHGMIARSAAPLRAVESDFAVDSSGFSTSKFVRWYDEKYGVTRTTHAWVKIHIACGTKTNVVTAVRILDKDAADCPQFAPLVSKTAETFTVDAVSADKAYLSHANLEMVNNLGGTAFIPFKSNSGSGEPGSLWERMYHYYQFRQQEFLDHYHRRSNVESTFSAIKRVFGDSVRSKTDAAMVNEVLAKVLCHNLRCVIHSQTELGIEPVFWPETANPSDAPILQLLRR